MSAAPPPPLFDPARHEPLAASPWDEARACAAIRSIAERAVHERLASGHWPVHPLDAGGGDTPRTGFKGLYLGSAGVLWALWWLARQGAMTEAVDAAADIEQTLADYLADPDTGESVPSYFLGEVGLRLVRWRVGGVDAAGLDAMHAAIEANIPNPTNEALWAAPGTMVAAWHLWQATAQERWRALYLANVEQVWRTWQRDERALCHLWTQDLYGSVVQYLGAGHGFAGNVYPLLKGASLLDAARRDALYARCVEAVAAFAQRDGEAANWPPGSFATRPGRPAMLVQWCHGAPGIVTALADFAPGRSERLDALLVAAGETVWRAGPLAKGAGLCHGTAGNGCALLALYRRTGDARWLDRARAFAMHAIGQVERQWAEHGRARHSLWTGDAGVAVYLWQCRDGIAGMPALDFV